MGTARGNWSDDDAADALDGSEAGAASSLVEVDAGGDTGSSVDPGICELDSGPPQVLDSRTDRAMGAVSTAAVESFAAAGTTLVSSLLPGYNGYDPLQHWSAEQMQRARWSRVLATVDGDVFAELETVTRHQRPVIQRIHVENMRHLGAARSAPAVGPVPRPFVLNHNVRLSLEELLGETRLDDSASGEAYDIQIQEIVHPPVEGAQSRPRQRFRHGQALFQWVVQIQPRRMGSLRPGSRHQLNSDASDRSRSPREDSPSSLRKNTCRKQQHSRRSTSSRISGRNIAIVNGS